MGEPLRAKIPVYANINRRTLDRTPEGFANSASDAIRAGFNAIKIAPFDSLDSEKSKIETIKFIDEGVARVDAIRRAIGSDARLMVDCHWRFNEMSAHRPRLNWPNLTLTGLNVRSTKQSITFPRF
ncbi:enolase C-terminal domain-like protein [Pararhizobium sp. IMCC21322]|uniref:enolase C-terminal domain-like protein n=1 Tax=Pararhizobium sp. IMCC21322 TaxID=3067903 RepID=UPI002740BA39|nr:enolase C-terminal domain-like protein [Pararhizobium sp. IMCC21322]